MGAALTKLDVCTSTYPAEGAPQPHGVASINGTPGTTTFAYDSDGNVTGETGATTRTLGWTMFNMPATISYGSKTIGFQYDADHNRVMQTAPNGTTYYLPDGEQTPGASAGPVWHTYFQADGERVVEDFGSTGSLKHHFFHDDYQNTIGLVTDDTFTEAGWSSGTGIVQNELSDVFGQPRLHTGAIDPNWGAADVTKRRYINQEDLTPVQLINLNARVYDPLLGKFMSPDPVISDQDDSQSWNAYAYVHNNPMSKEDPTGLWYVEGRCLCFGSGQQINDEILQIGAEQEIRMNFPLNIAVNIITAMELQKSTRTPEVTLELSRLTSVSSALGSNIGFLAEIAPERKGDQVTQNGSQQDLGENVGDNTARQRPELDAIANSPAVNSAMDKAWQLSNPYDGDPHKRLEHGFFIFQTPYGQWVPDVGITGIDNRDMPAVTPWSRDQVWFHTHPNVNPPNLLAGGYNYGPSFADWKVARSLNMPGIIRSPDRLHFYGPPLGPSATP